MGWVLVLVVAAIAAVLALSIRVVQQYEEGVLFRLGVVKGVRGPGAHLVVPVLDSLRAVSRQVVTLPIRCDGLITKDDVSVDLSAVVSYRVVDAVKSVLAVEDVRTAVGEVVQTSLRKVVGQHTLDQVLSDTDQLDLDARAVLDVATADWGLEVVLVELKGIRLPDALTRALAREAEAERERRVEGTHDGTRARVTAPGVDAPLGHSDPATYDPFALDQPPNRDYLWGRFRPVETEPVG